MKRVAFKMKLKPGNVTEYKKRHREIWPELVAHIQNNGVGNYSIFLDEDHLTLFAFQTQSNDFSSTTISEDPIMKKWWTFMSDIMEVNEDHSPQMSELEEVFFLP